MDIEMKAKSLVIIDDPNQADRLIALAGRNQGGDRLTVVALNEGVYRDLAARGLEYKTPADYGLSDGDIEDELVKWFRTLPDTKIKDNKNIKELLVHDGISLWWLVDEVLYWHSFIFPSLKQVISQVIALNNIIGVEEPGAVYYAKNSKPASRILELICNSRNIQAVAIPGSYFIGRRLSRRLRGMVYIYSPWIRVFCRKMGWMVLGGNTGQKKQWRDGKVLIFSGDSWENVPDLATGELKKGDPYFYSVIDLIKDKRDITFITIPGKFNWGIRNFRDKSRQQDVAYRPFEYYLNRRIIKKARSLAKELNRSYQSLTDYESYKKSIRLNDIPLYDLIEGNLSFTFSKGHLSTVTAIFEAAKLIIEIEKPGAVIVCGEFIVYERAAVAAAKLKGIPVLSVQHGIYSPYFIHYNYNEADLSLHGEAIAPYCPIADRFAVYSQQDKDNFVNRGKVRESNVIISSQPRYDILAVADRVFNREKTFKRLNLDPEKKLVVWMSLSQTFTPQENNRNRGAVYNAVKSLKDVQLVIKLHPEENKKTAQYDKGRFFKPKIVGGWGSFTFELLNAANVVITHYCTTAIEAIILNKPLIIIDFSGRLTKVPYIESGAAICVDNETALAPEIEKILYDRQAQQALAEAQRRYAIESGCFQGGQASRIVADLVTRMIEETKKGGSLSISISLSEED
jgi:UDP-N-acetylglucosamine 2-epimerase